MSRIDHSSTRNVWSRSSSVSRASGELTDSEMGIPDGEERMERLFNNVLGDGSTNGTRLADETIRQPYHHRFTTGTGPSGSGATHHRQPPSHTVQTPGNLGPFPTTTGGTTQHRPQNINREDADFMAVKLRLEQAKLVSQTVASINSRWTSANSLAADGNNFAQWTRELRETGSSHLSDD